MGSDLQQRSSPQDLAQVKSPTLRNVVRVARGLTVAPLVAGASQSSALISLGHYLSALECATISGLITCILIISLALADRVIDFMEKRQPVKESQQ